LPYLCGGGATVTGSTMAMPFTNERHNNSSKTTKTELKRTHHHGWEDLKLKAPTVVSRILFGGRVFSYTVGS
jgi:hypothetical protein